ncbi:DUF6350 family protein [Nocardioides ferulae]|uniref:cell division protein PerM n=1 Tax=Nocardioides ferulae TaxID=2340821 RepID=UPI000EAC27BD|nr:DUF6350 family protein [Nocardioides ferulae]
MTSLLPSSATRARGPRGTGEARRDLRHRRPLLLTALAGGASAAGATLLLCLATALAGWFLTDAGAHGAPRDALRTGALGWLMAHGSGVHVDSVSVTVLPLGVTLLAGWASWRLGHRVGAAVSGHGPDADALADGQRDWTVPVGVVAFAAGYAATALSTLALAGTEATAPAAGGVLRWSLLLAVAIGGPALAVGSGRAAIWARVVPGTVPGALEVSRRLLVWWLALSAAVLVVALLADLGTALNVMAQLHTDAGEATVFTVLTATVVPNAVVFAGSYLLGPGFTVGAGTLVAPTAVVVGPLPMFPLLAALPDSGPTPAWVAWLMLLPPLVAAAATARTLLRGPGRRARLGWVETMVRGTLGGVLAGVAFGVSAAVAGGAVGPGRMREVGPLVSDVLVHGVATFGVGGLLGALVAVLWQRRAAARTPAAGH